MGNEKLKFVVYAPSFDENSGGGIALHRLCDLLNQNDEEAYLAKYYYDIPKFDKEIILRSIYRKLRWFIQRYFIPYKTNKLFKTPIINNSQIDDNCVVIYPEIVSGNPLGAKNIIRWFLHKPGFHKGVVNYGENELYFFYQVIFNDTSINPHDDHLLIVTWVRDDIYKHINTDQRSGSCYMLRKGRGKKIVHDLKGSILLDGKSHKEIAKTMNECEYFISYDLQTMYSQYAVLCGCKSVVIPEKGISKDEWQPKKEFQYGIAYGFDDIEEAEKTKHLVYEAMKKEEANSNESVKFFIKKVYEFFGSNK